MSLQYKTTFCPQPGDMETIRQGLRAYNVTQIGEYDSERCAIYVRDDREQIVGGLYGHVLWDWLYIECLWIHPDLRDQGVGTRLIALAEQAALARGVDKIHLETTSFQALDFYRKNGFELFAELKGKPAGHSWYYLKKEGITV
jgi:ribosomal protein S18 acetylase RimI-like enzyme